MFSRSFRLISPSGISAAARTACSTAAFSQTRGLSCGSFCAGSAVTAAGPGTCASSFPSSADGPGRVLPPPRDGSGISPAIRGIRMHSKRTGMTASARTGSIPRLFFSPSSPFFPFFLFSFFSSRSAAGLISSAALSGSRLPCLFFAASRRGLLCRPAPGDRSSPLSR